MTFFEKELRKIVEPVFPDARYVGRACYVRLNDINRAKIQFVTGGISSQYNALRLTVLNRQEGEIDRLLLRFGDLMGAKMGNHPSFRSGAEPHIWDDDGNVDWYAYHPTQKDYETLTEAVEGYLEIFQEQTEQHNFQHVMQ